MMGLISIPRKFTKQGSHRIKQLVLLTGVLLIVMSAMPPFLKAQDTDRYQGCGIRRIPVKNKNIK